MKSHPILCEAIEVRTEDGVCRGLAKTKVGEKHIIDGRTPETPGMCSNAFCALSNAAFIMMVTDQMRDEVDGHIDRVCPHGVVTYRLSRAAQGKSEPYNVR
jgi:hypothetical protein